MEVAEVRGRSGIRAWYEVAYGDGTPAPVESLNEALRVYSERGGQAPIPSSHSEYDANRGGWLLANVNGELALARDDGTIE